MCFDNSWLSVSSRVQQSRQTDEASKPQLQWDGHLPVSNGYADFSSAPDEAEYEETLEECSISEDIPAFKRQRLEDRDLTNDLPDECISQIFVFLPNPNDRGSCALVCRRWLQIQGLLGWNGAAPFAVGPVESRAEGAGASGKAPNDEGATFVGDLSRCLEGRHASDTRLLSMAIGLPSRGGLNRLVVRGDRLTAVGSISTSSRLTNLGFQAIVGSSPGLQSLTLWNCPYVDDEVMRMLASRCKSLRRLDIMNCTRVTDKGLSLISRGCKQLQHLSVSACPRVSNASLAATAAGSRQLASLALADLPLVNEHGLKLLGKCQELKRLRLSGRISVTDPGMKLVGQHLVGLVWLKLSDLPLLTEEGFRAIGEAKGFQSLQSLSLVSCKNLTNDSLQAVASGCSGLKSLAVSKCHSLTCCGIKNALDAAGSLQSLTLHKLSGLSTAPATPSGFCCDLNKEPLQVCDGGCCIWSGSCANLTALSISHCEGVDSRCLSMLGRSSAGLQSLELAGLREAEDNGVISLVEGCGSKLTSVDLSGCSKISDKAVVAISKYCSSTVRSLSLDGCTKVTDRSLRAIAASCTVLEDLDLSRCDISDRGLIALVTSIGSSLLNLSVSGCLGITDKSLKKIMTQCQSLTGLNLKNCPGLSKEAVRSIQLSSHCLSGPSCLFVDDS